VERFSPGQGWSALPAMSRARGNPAAAFFEGRLYVIGGYPPSGLAFDDVEVYEPQRDRWSAGPSLPARLGSAGAAVARGRLYVAGGDDGSDGAPSGTSLYVLEAGAEHGHSGPGEHSDGHSDGQGDRRGWRRLSDMPTGRGLLKLQELDGLLYAMGGVGENGFVDAVERYDPLTDSWRAASHLRVARGNPGVAVLDHRIVVVGGAGSAEALVGSEIYDPGSDTWRLLEPLMSPGRGSLIAASQQGRTVLAIGGFEPQPGGGFAATARVEALRLT
jgi:N-acetylneuraminic acid mutarotase